jgi:myo-inositol-1(or 4)-monophosphatase
MAEIDLPNVRDVLIQTALQAGQQILSASAHSPSALDTKKNSADLVTETDRAVEAFISSTLRQHYPTYAFMGEETYVPGQKLGPEPTFVVDPIDGTTNFVHGWPYISVSLGLSVQREAVVGVVYNPFSGRLYHGAKGEGSYLRIVREGQSLGEDQRLPLRQLSPLTGLDSCLVAIEFGSDRSGPNWSCKTSTWAKLGASKAEGGAMIHSARALGSAALNLCGVAEGSLDVYWEGGCWAWDVCAGWVVLREAGGIIVDGNPAQWEIPITNRKYLAVRGCEGGKGQKELIEEFWGFVQGQMEYEH